MTTTGISVHWQLLCFVTTTRISALWQLQKIFLCYKCRKFCYVKTARNSVMYQLHIILFCDNYSKICSITMTTTGNYFMWQLQEFLLIYYTNPVLWQQQEVLLCNNYRSSALWLLRVQKFLFCDNYRRLCFVTTTDLRQLQDIFCVTTTENVPCGNIKNFCSLPTRATTLLTKT